MSRSFGDIVRSRFWVSAQVNGAPAGYHLYLGKTYQGTTHGFILTLGRLVIMGHRRGLQ